MKNVLFKRNEKHKAASCLCMVYFVDIFIKTSFIFAKSLSLNWMFGNVISFGESRKDEGGESCLAFLKIFLLFE